MVRPVYSLPQDPTDDAAAARHWLEALPEHYPPGDRDRLARACGLLVRCRGNKTRDTGETQVRHLLCTADILVRLRMDADTLIAALLNGCIGVLEGGAVEIKTGFGGGIARMVEDLARIAELVNVEAVIAAKDQGEHDENLRRLLLGIVEDVRVVLVVLAERLHLMRSIKRLASERRREIAEDTHRVYAPLANRLGVWQIKWELEDLSLRYLAPDEYKGIAEQLDGRRAEREAFIAGVVATLKAKFDEAGIRADISGRPKHIYSIWRKMQHKQVDIEEIFDLRAVRVLVEDIASCYAALGVVHGLWRHIPKEFDDYIATPKRNLYRSLHTAVIGPENKPLEVQIRTFEMHKHAELGVAAHWAYKEKKQQDEAFQRRVVLMRNWLELKNEGDDGGDFVERFKDEFEPVHIYVLTPQAKVIELPKDATALDFAYAIHSEVGNRCRGAKVDGNIVPLNQSLMSGQTVEILTQKNAAPSRDWLSPHLGYLKTAKARNRVRQWFKQQDFDHYVDVGRAVLDKELTRLHIDEKPHLDQICRRYNFNKGPELLAALGRGDVTPGQVARLVGEPKVEERKEPPGKLPPAQSPAIKPLQVKRPQTAKKPAKHAAPGPEIIVEGVADLMTHMAHCCKPVPYDPILGYVTRGRGVTIHRRDCANLRRISEQEKARLIDVRWADQSRDAAYLVDLLVLAVDRKGLLRDISTVFSDEEIDVLGVNTASDRTKERATMRFTVEIKDASQLKRVRIKLGQVPDVFDVRRPH